MNNKTIVMLTGHAQVGKDTFAKRLIEKHGFTRVAFADPMREALLKLNPCIPMEGSYGTSEKWATALRQSLGYSSTDYRLAELVKAVGWDAAKTEVSEVRQLLQHLGTEVGREILGESVWVGLAAEKIIKQNLEKVVITDARFANEITSTKKWFAPPYNVQVIDICRPGTKPVNGHKSDAGLSEEWVDYHICNEGTVHDLNRDADALMRHLGL